MSKKHKKKTKQALKHDPMVDVLDQMLECGACADAGTFHVPEEHGIDQIDHLCEVLPGIGYIENLLVDYLFSNGLTTGNITQDKVLNDFLFSKNIEGNPHIDVLRDVLGNASLYGETGLRWYEGSIYMTKAGTYGALIDKRDGILYPALFFCSNDGRYVAQDEVKVPEDATIESFEEYFEQQDLILLDKSNFVNVRNDTKELHGESPLLSDTLRIKLLEAVYSRLNYDIRYDGPGRIILRPKDGYASDEINEVDTTSLLNASVISTGKRLDKAKEEARRVGAEIQHSSSDDVIVLSNAFDKEITHLERVTKATQFFDWLDNEGAIIAQAIGLPPSLLELGKVSGNVSMQRILDNAMENAIVPLREKFASQISPLLSAKLGIDKVYFGKYQRASAPSKETVWGQIVEQMTMLNAIERPETDKLVKDFAQMLSYEIHNSDGSLVELSMGNIPDDEYKESKSDVKTKRRNS